MAIEAGILEGTRVDAKPLRSDHGYRRIALIWRRSSPRENEFQLLAATLRQIMIELSPALGSTASIERSRTETLISA
jgi:LysR family hydrogen peroxide-inducible transcriptional activator